MSFVPRGRTFFLFVVEKGGGARWQIWKRWRRQVAGWEKVSDQGADQKKKSHKFFG